MKIPNIDGNYKTKDGKVKVIVTRKEIEFEVTGEPQFVIIDDIPNRKPPANDLGEQTKRGLKFINDALMG